MSKDETSEITHSSDFDFAKVFAQETWAECEFPQILSAVRQANGGPCVGNEEIEKRWKDSCVLSDSSSCTFYSALSSDCESYRTAESTPCEPRSAVPDVLEHGENFPLEKSLPHCGDLYSSTNLGNDIDQISHNKLTVYSEILTPECNILVDDQNRNEKRFGILFQSEEDEDVYYHPLKEQIQKDPEWQNLRLRRKGTETTLTARSYYMNLDEDDISFQPSTSAPVSHRVKPRKSKISKRKSFR
ncbi:hypothetical protein QAD02_019340 [Eretmocerus hayati]|uniref:Uncharacterized protein n=1 Tax=Eretmocerus hayati TaxID=131215 RepID=A0ACC2PKG5_9HYME|nr:hypothetical protein QAD02_019340 [Eretmocerus hayati]